MISGLLYEFTKISVFVWNVVAAVPRRAWPYIATAAAILAAVLLARRSSQLSRKLDEVKAKNETAGKMRDAMARRPRDRRELIDRLRRDGL